MAEVLPDGVEKCGAFILCMSSKRFSEVVWFYVRVAGRLERLLKNLPNYRIRTQFNNLDFLFQQVRFSKPVIDFGEQWISILEIHGNEVVSPFDDVCDDVRR